MGHADIELGAGVVALQSKQQHHVTPKRSVMVHAPDPTRRASLFSWMAFGSVGASSCPGGRKSVGGKEPDISKAKHLRDDHVDPRSTPAVRTTPIHSKKRARALRHAVRLLCAWQAHSALGASKSRHPTIIARPARQ